MSESDIQFHGNTEIISLGSFQGSQQVSSVSCAELSYRIFTQAPSIYLTLYAEGPCNKLGTAGNLRLKLN